MVLYEEKADGIDGERRLAKAMFSHSECRWDEIHR
jgi:hypothetical protein